MSVIAAKSGFSYEARARIADNLLVARRRAGLSHVTLGEFAVVSSGRISEMENGKVVGMLDTYVRLAGALGLSLEEILAGVRWLPGQVRVGDPAGYLIEFELDSEMAAQHEHPQLRSELVSGSKHEP